MKLAVEALSVVQGHQTRDAAWPVHVSGCGRMPKIGLDEWGSLTGPEPGSKTNKQATILTLLGFWTSIFLITSADSSILVQIADQLFDLG